MVGWRTEEMKTLYLLRFPIWLSTEDGTEVKQEAGTHKRWLLQSKATSELSELISVHLWEGNRSPL